MDPEDINAFIATGQVPPILGILAQNRGLYDTHESQVWQEEEFGTYVDKSDFIIEVCECLRPLVVDNRIFYDLPTCLEIAEGMEYQDTLIITAFGVGLWDEFLNSLFGMESRNNPNWIDYPVLFDPTTYDDFVNSIGDANWVSEDNNRVPDYVV